MRYRYTEIETDIGRETEKEGERTDESHTGSSRNIEVLRLENSLDELSEDHFQFCDSRAGQALVTGIAKVEVVVTTVATQIRAFQFPRPKLFTANNFLLFF